MANPSTPALARCESAITEATRRNRRRRVRFLSLSYDRSRHLAALSPTVAQLIASADSLGIPLRPETTRSIMADLVHRLRIRLTDRRNDQARVDALRIALYGEARIYARQRMVAMFSTAAE